MRNFDNWDVYFDLNGNPLHGAVQFNVKDGNTPARVFDSDGVAIANPILTDANGRTDIQAFVDSDVVAYFYRYVGPGRFSDVAEDSIDTSDESLWSLQYTVESQDGRLANITGQALMGVSTMDRLRALDPETVPVVDGLKAITLNGYYTGGDCEPVNYVWNPNSTAQDDNGGCIKPDGLLTGRWIMVVPTEHCDSRHFGVFGVDSEYDTVDYATRISQLVRFCNTNSIRPYFDGTAARPYFPYSRINVSSRNPVDVSAGTVFVDREDSNFFGDWNGDPLFLNGNTQLKCTSAKASWNWKDLIEYREVVLDAATVKTEFRDARIVVTYPTAGKTFIHCELVSDGKLAENEFRNCVLRGAMFTGERLSPTVDDDCIIHPKDFHGRMDLWCVLRSQQHEPVIDLEMETLDHTCTISLDGIYFKDALFDGFEHTATVAVGFEDCKGSLTLNAAGNFILTAEDSELNITFTGTGEVGVGYQPALNIHDGSVSFVNSLTYLLALGATGSALAGNPVLVNGDVSLDNVNIGTAITLRGALVMRYCTMNSNMLHYTVNQVAQVKMEHCNLNAYYSLTPAVPGTVVQGCWSNNYSSIDSPILLDRTNIDLIDSHHSYTYSGNTGGFIPYETKPVVHEFTIHHSPITGSLQPPTEPYVLTQMVLGGSDSDTNGRPSGYILPWYSSPNFDTIKMFRIGVDRFQVKARLTAWPQLLENEGTTGEYQYNRYHDALLGAYFKDGFTWGVMPFWDDPSVTPPTQLTSAANPRFFKGSLSFSFNNMPTFNDYHMSMAIQYECLDKHD